MTKLKMLGLFLFSSLFVILNTSIKDVQYEKKINEPNLTLIKNSSSYDTAILESVILIEIYANIAGQLMPVASGTGFAVKYDKKENSTYLMTNNHICDIESYMFMIYTLKSDPIFSNVLSPDRLLTTIAKDPSNDICIVKAENIKMETVSFRKSSELSIMDQLYSIGAPKGVFPIWVDGRLSGRISREYFSMNMGPGFDFLLISGIFIGGQSGSPIYDESGRVVGILFASYDNQKGTSYGGLAIPSEAMIEFIKENIGG